MVIYFWHWTKVLKKYRKVNKKYKIKKFIILKIKK